MTVRNKKGLRTRVSVTVVIPCYNCALTLRRTIESVVEQTVLPEQIIFVDDASTDASREIIHVFQQRYSSEWLKVIHLQQNQGPAYARNKGIEEARSDYIAFLDADDTWHPQKLEVQHEWMKSNPEVTLTGHKIRQTGDGKKKELLLESIQATKISSIKALLSNPFSTPTVMMKSNLPYRFDPGQHYAEDYLLWLKICLSNHTVYRLETALAYMHKAAYGQAGLSQNLLAMEKGELSTYSKIYESKAINLLQYYGLVLFSLTKFVRRIVMSGIARKTT